MKKLPREYWLKYHPDHAGDLITSNGLNHTKWIMLDIPPQKVHSPATGEYLGHLYFYLDKKLEKYKDKIKQDDNDRFSLVIDLTEEEEIIFDLTFG